jgi:hypothetical protein
MHDHEKRVWVTRIVAIAAVTSITLYAMYLEIDGIFVPIAGAAVVSGIAGYEVGARRFLASYLPRSPSDSEAPNDKSNDDER